MNAERAREFLLTLPHVHEAEQWGGLLFWLGDKAIGGKMLAMLHLEPGDGHAIMYPAGPERFHELLELDGIIPAPYMARIHWVAATRWDVHRNTDWEAELRAAHALTYSKLPPKTLKFFAMSKAEQKKVLAERRKVIAAREAAKKAAKPNRKRTHMDI